MIEKLQGLVSELDGKLGAGEIDKTTYDIAFEYMSRAFDIVLDDMPTEIFQFMEGGY